MNSNIKNKFFVLKHMFWCDILHNKLRKLYIAVQNTTAKPFERIFARCVLGIINEVIMIAYLRGTLEEIGNDYIIVDVNNIGYQVKVSLRVIESLPGLGKEIKIHTYTYVREDVLALYGFSTKDDLDMFLLLLGVNGVGPKGALGILSVFSAQELRLAIISQDSKTIAKAPGIGAKTAQRMLIDLKDKVSMEETFEHLGAGTSVEESTNVDVAGARSDAVEALTALGYSPAESLKAVKSVVITEDMNSEAILKAALKHIL